MLHPIPQTQFNSTIKTLRTNHGGEYTSHDFTTYLLSHGIAHQFSCPYTSEQNGIAERKNRHILETARTLLHHASLFTFWLEAASTATYLINRLPTKTLHMQSPYQKLYHKSPSFLHLKTFGCLCYPWTAYTRAHKLDPKSSPCIFLGYSTDHKGFRCFDPSTSKLIISRHVRFHEHEFPMVTPSLPPPPPHLSTIHNPLLPPLRPTFYPPPPNPPPSPTPPPTEPPTLPPPHHYDTHIQYRRRPKATPHPPPLFPHSYPSPSLHPSPAPPPDHHLPIP